jgi:hypothetical protein
MHTGEVVPHEIEGEGMAVVFELFGESVRQPGKPAEAYPCREVMPLDIARGDVTSDR